MWFKTTLQYREVFETSLMLHSQPMEVRQRSMMLFMRTV